jgi:hypothetical protein
VGGRFHIKRKNEGIVGGSIGVIQPGAERVGVVEFAADVHGEFKFPTHGLDDVRGSDFIAVRVMQCHFDVGTFLKRRDLDVDTQTVTIGIGLGRKSADPCLFRNSACEIIFWEEKVHLGIITIKEDDRLYGRLALDYSFFAMGIDFCYAGCIMKKGYMGFSRFRLRMYEL